MAMTNFFTIDEKSRVFEQSNIRKSPAEINLRPDRRGWGGFFVVYYPRAMKKLTHDEIAAQRLTLDALRTEPRLPITVLLDNIRSLYNVGSIFRTSDGGRIARLILTGYTPHPPRKEIEKTALGATESVPWEYVQDPLVAIAGLKREGIAICALEHTSASVPYHTLKQESFPLCLVVGNEISGVSPAILEAADLAVDIPMYGMKQSLNAAVAYGIALFEFVRIARGDGVATPPRPARR
jgi:tRNA G18 (ribose-2'-O)-methylase SpoU